MKKSLTMGRRSDAYNPKSQEPRAKSQEPRAKSQEPRAKSQEPRAKSQEPRAKSQEPRAKSQEPRAHSGTPALRHSGTPALLNHRRPSTFSAACLGCGRTLLVLLAVLSAALRFVFAASQNHLTPHHGCKRAVFVFAALLLLTGATAQAQTEVWSGTLTVKDLGNLLGCSNAIEGARCRDTAILTDDDFTYDSTDYVVHNLFLHVGPAGRLEISFIPDLATAAQALTLDVAGTKFAFEDADVKEERQRVWASTGLSWSGGDTVAVKLTETPTSTNNAPIFTDGASTTRSVAENTTSGQDIGTAIAATDADSGDTLEYTLGGTDAASFAIDSTSGQLQTSAALDFETTSSYAVTVSVSDGNGGSDSIGVTITVTDMDEKPATPAAPTVSATANSHTSLDVSWTAPGLNGGSAITGYNLQYRQGTSGPWTNGPQNVSGTSAAITGLAAGTSYQVQARALNGETPSDWSSAGTGSTSSAPATAPGVPRTLTATPGDGEVVLTWTAPASDGGEAITRYEYRHKATSSLPFVSSDSWTSAGTARTATVGSLTNGTPYSFEVRAVNTVGAGTAATASATTAGTANTAPVFTDGASTTRSVAENTAASQNIGTAVAATDADSGDTLRYTLGGTDGKSFGIHVDTGQLLTQAALDFETKSSYAVTVSVSDGNGGSDSIDVTITVTDMDEKPATPGVPTVSATANSDTSLDVSWTAPGLNGGPAITGYNLQYRQGTSGSFTNGPQNVSGTSTTITSLTADTSYQVQVRALNGETPSDWSPSGTGSASSATATAPGVPRTLAAAPGDGEVVLTWTAPASDGGETITRYEYRHKATSSLPFVSSDSWTSAGTARTATVGSLTNGTPYSFEVRAVNTVGAGTAATASATTAGTANTAPVFTDGASTTRSVAENTAASQNIGTAVAATDADSGDTLRYTLGGTDGKSFGIHVDTGQLLTQAALDFETKSSYAVTVSVSDGNGGSDSIDVTITVTDMDEKPATPGVPTVSATANSDTSLDVSWTAPGLNGGPAITGYNLQYRQGTSGSFTNGPQNVSGTSTTITSLTADTSYQVQVRALNGETPSDWSPSGTGSASSATATAPGVPRTLAAAPGDGEVVLTWTAPASDGGETITRYEYRHKATSSLPFVSSDSWTSAGTARTATVGSLTNGTPYSFEVRAVNTVGEGTAATANATPLATARVTQPTLTLDVDPNRFSEANGTVTVCVVPSAPSTQRITVQVATADGTATAPGDYSSYSSTVALQPQQQRACFTVTLVDDAEVEGDETFTVTLSNPVNATLGTPVATFTIVDNENVAATGTPTISGTPRVGRVLTAAPGTIADANGLTSPTYRYQWLRADMASATGTAITGATGRTYTLANADQGKYIRVRVSFTDAANNSESRTSRATPAVQAVQAVANTPATGQPTITGTPRVGQTLTAVTDDIADADGLGAFSYQWKADGADIAEATDSSYTLAADDLGKRISVRVRFTDDANNSESRTSEATAGVTAANTPATGQPTITGTPRVGQTLTAVTDDIADADGLGAFSYQWKADGADIAEATDSSYTLAADDLGKRISVRVRFTDDANNSESRTSRATPAVQAVQAVANTPATGQPTITGTPRVGQTLTAVTDDIADADGLGAFSYQWKADGADIAEATDSSYTLAADDLGKRISVRVRFTDDGGSEETVTSEATAAINKLLQLQASFAQAEYQAAEGGEPASINVNLSPAADRRVEVPLVVKPQGGVTSADYDGVPASVVFEVGMTVATFQVAALADQENDPGESLALGFGDLPEAVRAGDPPATTVILTQQRSAAQFSASLKIMLAVAARSVADSALTAIQSRFQRKRQLMRTRKSGPGPKAGGGLSASQADSDGSGLRRERPATSRSGQANRFGRNGNRDPGAKGIDGSGKRGEEGPVAERGVWSPAKTRAAEGFGGAAERPESGTPGSWLQNFSLGSLGSFARSGQTHSRVSAGYGQDRLQGSWNRDSSLWPGSAKSSGIGNREISLAGASFNFAMGESAGGSPGEGMALWGQGGLQSFHGNLTRSGMNYRGLMKAAHVGLDLYNSEQMLVGFSFMRSWADMNDMNYTADGVHGMLGGALNTAHPYLYWQPNERFSAWVIGGLGRGEVDVNEPGRTHVFTADFRMFSGGMRSVLAQRGNTEVGVVVDSFTARLGTNASEDIERVTGQVSRTRMMLEMVHDKPLAAGRSLSVKAEFGGRHDEGDADRGSGAEAGFRLGFLDAASGLDVAMHGRMLLVHESDYRDFGVGMQVSWDPGKKDRGLQLSMMSSHGRDGGGRTTLWNNSSLVTRPIMGYMANASQTRTSSEVAYGMDVFGGRGLLTPYSRLQLAGYGRALRVGTELSLLSRWLPEMPARFHLEGIRRETPNGMIDLGMMLGISIPF